MDAAKSPHIEKVISDRIDTFLLQLAAEMRVDAEENGAKPSTNDLVHKINTPKFLDLFDQILNTCYSASSMPRPAFRHLFFQILEKRLETLTNGSPRFEKAIKRERRRRYNRTISTRKYPTSCPVCLDVPQCLSDPFTEFRHEACGKTGCTGHHYFYQTSGCHPNSGMISEYCTEHHVLTLICAKCEKPQIAFQLLAEARGRQTVIQ